MQYTQLENYADLMVLLSVYLLLGTKLFLNTICGKHCRESFNLGKFLIQFPEKNFNLVIELSDRQDLQKKKYKAQYKMIQESNHLFQQCYHNSHFASFSSHLHTTSRQVLLRGLTDRQFIFIWSWAKGGTEAGDRLYGRDQNILVSQGSSAWCSP